MDDRSERLRKRRKQSARRSNGRSDASEPEEPSEPADPSESSKPSDPTEPPEGTASPDRADDEGTAGDDGPQPVKDQQIGTYMYLPEGQVKRLRRQYNVLKAEYEFEYDEEFEKNRHFYPLVVKYGLERLDGMDTAEIRDRLQELYR
jgi:hypothetical protein